MKHDGLLDKSNSGDTSGDHYIDFSSIENQGGVENTSVGGAGSSLNGSERVVTVLINNGESMGNAVSIGETQESGSVPRVLESKLNQLMITGGVSPSKKASLSRSDSFPDQCRVCQHPAEEALIDLGCHCRGGLAKAHRSCIDTWFLTRGSNKCEICQQIAINVAPPESQPSRNYWIWRVDPSFRGPVPPPDRERLYSPLWVAFSILIGGLLLDVLISISLGVSALPVNIIIGILVILGLGTALRLAMECFHEVTVRRAVQNMDRNASLGPSGYHTAV
ncbi:hypothetical protein ACHQM5_012042 [Ranunculus cassubicifolius]